MLPVLNLDDIAVEKANPINTVGIIGPVTTKDINGGYKHIAVTLYYPAPEAGAHYSDLEQLSEQLSENEYNQETAKNLGLRTFTARWNVREEWFTPEFRQQLDAGLVDDNEKIQYSINLAGLTRGLAKAARQNTIDLEAVSGAVVGFKATAGKKEPDRLQIRSFFPPSKNK